jgi:hypothetical protein
VVDEEGLCGGRWRSVLSVWFGGRLFSVVLVFSPVVFSFVGFRLFDAGARALGFMVFRHQLFLFRDWVDLDGDLFQWL